MRHSAGGRRGFWAAAAAAALLYTLIASPRLGKDSAITELGMLRLPEARTIGETPSKPGGDWSAFSNIENFGFYSPRGIEWCFRLEPMAACDGSTLLEASAARDSTECYKLMEGKKATFPFLGHPFIESFRLFLVRQDQQGIVEIDDEGKTVWSREFGSTLTCASAVANHSAWGTLGGEILVQNGRDTYRTILPAEFGLGLLQACIYSVAVSPDGNTVAALCGLNPQYALFFNLEGQRYNLVHAVKLQSASNRAEPAVFSADGTFAVMRTASGLLMYLPEERSTGVVQAEKFGGEVELSMKPWGKDRVALLCASEGGKYLSLVRKGILEAYLKVEDDASGLSVGKGDSLSVSGRSFIRRFGLKGTSE